MIDEAGNVYEGRYSGDDGIPAFDTAGDMVTAFHTSGYNSGNLGIALIGTLVDQGPTDAAKTSLTRLIKVVARFKGLDAQAKVTFVNPVNGVTKDVTSVSGHRDWLQTDCPGQTMYDLLDEVRAQAGGK
ncbi:peptidoglycan recognition family protein [Streptomyces sp. NPDC005917]|uniref:peptidoglycan recognition protein family protein n=1 Tax=unclassified Streptomyces TaxID=2593676 RepID=UPI0033C78147